MSRKNSYLTVSDQFCGAGGSSQGVRRFAQRRGLGNGLQVKLALNHWKLAIETHAHNFPDTIHDCTDIQACDPRYYPSTDILVTSPECTNHSVAKGRKQVKAQLDAFDRGEQDPAAERSRATMWDVVRFAEHHQYRVVITENVVDARAWVLWDAWIMAMHNLGYRHQCVFFNSMFAWPTPQSRDRMYVVFWKKGQRKPNLDIRPVAPCLKCGTVNAVQKFKPGANVKAKYGRQYVYVCPSCGKEVMPFYFAAINAIDWSLPAERIGDRKTPLKDRTMERIAFGLKKYGRRPLSVSMLDGLNSTWASRVKDACTDPLNTQHSQMSSAIASPFVVETKYSHAGEKRSRGMAETLPGQTGQQSLGVALPFVVDSSFTEAGHNYVQPGDKPLNTQTTTQSKGVAIPPALMVSTNYFDEVVRPVDQPLNAQTGSVKLGVAMTMSLNYPEQPPAPLDDPLRTVTTNRPEALITPYLADLRGTSKEHVAAASRPLDEPIGTVSAGGVHHALLSGRAMGFLSSYYGGSTQNVGLDEAMNTMATKDRQALLTGAHDLRVEDLYFRMLKPHEVKAGMAFDPDYVVLGNGRDQVKQLGNAVTPPVMEILIERCVESLM